MKEKIARWYDKAGGLMKQYEKPLGSSLLQMTMKISLATNTRR